MHVDHLKYVEVTGVFKAGSSNPKDARDNEETPNEDTDTDNSEKTGHNELYEGFFGVHFGLPLVSEHLRWVSTFPLDIHLPFIAFPSCMFPARNNYPDW